MVILFNLEIISPEQFMIDWSMSYNRYFPKLSRKKIMKASNKTINRKHLCIKFENDQFSILVIMLFRENPESITRNPPLYNICIDIGQGPVLLVL